MAWALTPGAFSGGATAGPFVDGTTKPKAADWQAAAHDIQTWGGNVDAGGNSLVNCAGVAAPTGTNPIIFTINGAEKGRFSSTGQFLVGITAAGSSSSKFQVKAATDENLAIQNAVSVTGSIVLNAQNDAGSANIPMEFRASQFVFPVGVPTSSAGLPSGAIWRDAASSNVIKMVP